MFETANPKQPFFVANQIELYPQDQKVLIKLYQPLVGSVAIALYQTLIENYDPYAILVDSQGIYMLQEQLDCSLKKLFEALHRLEATGLVQTFLIKNVAGDILAFKLLKVPGSQEFFATSLLASLLKDKLGAVAFQKLSHDFAKENQAKSKNLENARDVSASFFEVFRLPNDEAITPSQDVVQAAQENQTQAVKKATPNEHDKIDWDFMKQQYEIYQVESGDVDQNKDQIRSLMQVYGLNEQEFVEESLPALHGQNHLNMHQIQRLLSENYRLNQTRHDLQEKTKSSDAQIPNSLPDKQKKLLQEAQRLSPAEFLYQIKAQKGGFSSPSEKRILNVLHSQYGLQADLINILIYTCLTYDSVVSTSLAYRIANDWLQHGVTNAQSALEYLNQRQTGFAKRRSHFSQKRVEQGTDWKKKKAKTNANVNSEELKKFFSNPDNQ